MKKMLSMLLIAGMIAGTVSCAAADVTQLTKMAQKESKTPLDQLCMAVYEAVKADASSAVDVFKSVIMQRDSWTATETYSILRSVLLAAPNLEAGFVTHAPKFNNAPGSYTPEAVEHSGYQLLSALYTLPQTQPVAGTVTQGVLGSTITGKAAGSGVSSDPTEATAPTAPSGSPSYIVLPTPGSTSANN